jgi:hypothetical protein
MTMTRKHYEMIAADFAREVEQCAGQDRRFGAGTPLAALYSLAVRMTDTFQKTNDRFDSDRFLKACGF